MSDFSAFERLALPIVRALVALWVRPSVLPDDVKSHYGANRVPVYALEKRSVIDLAVLETARGGLLRAGMGVSEVNVGAVLNVQSDHLGLKGIDTTLEPTVTDIDRAMVTGSLAALDNRPPDAKDGVVLGADLAHGIQNLGGGK